MTLSHQSLSPSLSLPSLCYLDHFMSLEFTVSLVLLFMEVAHPFFSDELQYVDVFNFPAF